MVRSWLTERFGLTVPIVGAPMSGVAYGTLARAVTEGGGLGMLGLAGPLPPEVVAREAEVASDGGRLRFGIGLLGWSLEHWPAVFDATVEAGPSLVSVSAGPVEPYVERLHAAGATVAAQVHDAAGALAAVAAGVDLVVAQGTDAGGHTGTIGTLPLLQAVLAAVDVPVLAAGGIATGAGLAAVLAAGAQGAWVGTALLASPEGAGAAVARARIVAAAETDTVLTTVFDRAQHVPWPPGWPGRALRNSFTDRWHGYEDDLPGDAASTLAAARKADDYDTAYIYAGQAVGLVHAEHPAADVVRRIGADAEALLRQRFSDLLDS